MMLFDQRVGGARTALSARPHSGGRARTWLSALLCAGLATSAASAADPPAFRFQTNDVIAFVGGEDVVEMQRNGYLELLLTAALPHHKLRFRNLAFEGDTVFEQHRQLNFPSWEKQLERVGATVVIAQFGQAESLKGTNGLADFVAAYEKLLNRFTNGGRGLILLAPVPLLPRWSGGQPLSADQQQSSKAFAGAIFQIASQRQCGFVDLPLLFVSITPTRDWTRDGLHLNSIGHWSVAGAVAKQFNLVPNWINLRFDTSTGRLGTDSVEKLRQLILEKNRLWFDYWRPQNWAFLHGDRTEQPSSRDHRDLKKRWFPEEMEKFLPLIEAKEREIWEAAANLSKGK